jgi:hypothetical protein
MGKEVVEEISTKTITKKITPKGEETTEKISKKSIPKKSKEKVTKKIEKGPNKKSNKSDEKLEKILIENFISMQKVMTHLITKFDSLETKFSGLLELFESSAKSLAEKEINLELEGNEEKQQEILNELQKVLDQNKLIAKGITLMHEAAINPNISYAIGQGEEKDTLQKNEVMKETVTKEVTSEINTPRVMEEKSNNPPSFKN